LAPVGTEILAVQDGRVRSGPYAFGGGTSVLEVAHTHTEPSGKVVVDFIVRYGDLAGVARGIAAEAQIRQGQVIAYVGRRQEARLSVLHFEMYGPTASGVLTRRDRPPFMRDPALIDPTRHLNAWADRQ
jgi:murein DD-endopeptidase MepM/ murein hydrolase activator NlpD